MRQKKTKIELVEEDLVASFIDGAQPQRLTSQLGKLGQARPGHPTRIMLVVPDIERKEKKKTENSTALAMLAAIFQPPVSATNLGCPEFYFVFFICNQTLQRRQKGR